MGDFSDYASSPIPAWPSSVQLLFGGALPALLLIMRAWRDLFGGVFLCSVGLPRLCELFFRPRFPLFGALVPNLADDLQHFRPKLGAGPALAAHLYLLF